MTLRDRAAASLAAAAESRISAAPGTAGAASSWTKSRDPFLFRWLEVRPSCNNAGLRTKLAASGSRACHTRHVCQQPTGLPCLAGVKTHPDCFITSNSFKYLECDARRIVKRVRSRLLQSPIFNNFDFAVNKNIIYLPNFDAVILPSYLPGCLLI